MPLVRREILILPTSTPRRNKSIISAKKLNQLRKANQGKLLPILDLNNKYKTIIIFISHSVYSVGSYFLNKLYFALEDYQTTFYTP